MGSCSVDTCLLLGEGSGDWLMLDNMRVQHGRLPYVASDEQKRQLLTVYSSPRPAF